MDILVAVSMILLGRIWLLTSHQELKMYAKPADEATDFNINNTNSVKKSYLLTRIARRLVLFLFGYHLSYSKAVEVSEVAGSLMLHSVLASNKVLTINSWQGHKHDVIKH